MWAQYKKRFLVNQLFALSAGVASYFYFFPGQKFLLLVLLLAIELGALSGAWWAARLADKLAEVQKKLPLE
jgi:hypothetical protein